MRGAKLTSVQRIYLHEFGGNPTEELGVFHFRGRGCSRVNVRRSSRCTSWFHHSALEIRLPTVGRCEAGRISSSGERSEACIERPGLCC